jgi:hypothetical protein
MMRHSQNLYLSASRAIDDGIRKPLQTNRTQIGSPDNPVSMGEFNGLAHGLEHRGAIPATKVNAALPVVSDLPFMLQRRLRMEPIAHFRCA